MVRIFEHDKQTHDVNCTPNFECFCSVLKSSSAIPSPKQFRQSHALWGCCHRSKQWKPCVWTNHILTEKLSPMWHLSVSSVYIWHENERCREHIRWSTPCEVVQVLPKRDLIELVGWQPHRALAEHQLATSVSPLINGLIMPRNDLNILHFEVTQKPITKYLAKLLEHPPIFLLINCLSPFFPSLRNKKTSLPIPWLFKNPRRDHEIRRNFSPNLHDLYVLKDHQRHWHLSLGMAAGAAAETTRLKCHVEMPRAV